VLGLRLGEEAASHTVAELAGGKRLLLVLDNCEHLIEAPAQLAETIVRLCPRASILATSREVPRIDGEYVYRVPPLDVPPEDQADPEKVLEHSAVRLFVSRAAASYADFLPDQESLSDISAICRRLDGIPLAIEFSDQLLMGCLGVDRVVRIDIVPAGRCLGGAADLHVFRSFTVRTEIRTRLAWRHICQRFSGCLTSDGRALGVIAVAA
jgi:hypothetical protein